MGTKKRVFQNTRTTPTQNGGPTMTKGMKRGFSKVGLVAIIVAYNNWHEQPVAAIFAFCGIVLYIGLD